MEASISSLIFSSSITTAPLCKTRKTTMKCSNPEISPIIRINHNRLEGNRKLKWRVNVIEGASVAADAGRAEVTWQIVVGAVAGVTPFVVAGIEFSKRIIAQRRCEVCGGSGLVLREKEYFRCPGCGGFLPWQSWRRFFSG